MFEQSKFYVIREANYIVYWLYEAHNECFGYVSMIR
jgi:hypothetical protein